MNTAADEKTRNYEYYNSISNRYVRDASTSMMAHPTSGSANAGYRALARAVIFNALKDLREQTRERNRTIETLKSSSRYRILRQFTDNWGREMIEYYDHEYKVNRMISYEPSSDVRRFFYGKDYIFYAELAEINVSGPELMRNFLRKHPNGTRLSLDELIDG